MAKRNRGKAELLKYVGVPLPLPEFRALRQYAAQKKIPHTKAARELMTHGGFDQVVKDFEKMEKRVRDD